MSTAARTKIKTVKIADTDGLTVVSITLWQTATGFTVDVNDYELGEGEAFDYPTLDTARELANRIYKRRKAIAAA